METEHPILPRVGWAALTCTSTAFSFALTTSNHIDCAQEGRSVTGKDSLLNSSNKCANPLPLPPITAGYRFLSKAFGACDIKCDAAIW